MRASHRCRGGRRLRGLPRSAVAPDGRVFVLGSHRGQGISRCLLESAESFAESIGRTLLVLDTESGSVAEAVYRHLGWQRAGEIPEFALTPAGRLHTTVYYYKINRTGP